jgi:predicted amidohydrolase
MHTVVDEPTLTADRESVAALQVSCVQMHWAKSIDFNLQRTLHYIKEASEQGSRVVLFPEANLTSYYFPYLMNLESIQVQKALDKTCEAAASSRIWIIAGAVRKTHDRWLNLAYVINPSGQITHEFAKVHLAGRDETKYCRPGNKLSLFTIDGILCTLVICRDGRHPEAYRIPAMAGAQILFHPSCSSDEIEAVAWKRISGRAQQPVGPTTHIFHCVANTIGQSPDGRQTSSGASFIREPGGLSLAEAGYYQEEMITAVLELNRADRSYAVDSLNAPPFLKKHWETMIEEVRNRANQKPE